LRLRKAALAQQPTLSRREPVDAQTHKD